MSKIRVHQTITVDMEIDTDYLSYLCITQGIMHDTTVCDADKAQAAAAEILFAHMNKLERDSGFPPLNFSWGPATEEDFANPTYTEEI